ncbi:MAG: ComEA family DNA-binding protein [Terriglobia bacterium]
MATTRQRLFSRLNARGLGGLVLVVFLLAWAAAGAAKKKPQKPLDINRASVAELVQLPGVGEVIARRIVRHREKSGKFRRVEELLVIRGISRRKLEELRPYVTVEPEEAKETKKTKKTKKTEEKD